MAGIGETPQDTLLRRFAFTLCWVTNLTPAGWEWEWNHPLDSHWELLKEYGAPENLYGLRGIISKKLWGKIKNFPAFWAAYSKGQTRWERLPRLVELPFTLEELGSTNLLLVALPPHMQPDPTLDRMRTAHQAIRDLVTVGVPLWEDNVATFADNLAEASASRGSGGPPRDDPPAPAGDDAPGDGGASGSAGPPAPGESWLGRVISC